jgi:ABC-type dipeptide/oligopeptide/nickel transport system permease subunit
MTTKIKKKNKQNQVNFLLKKTWHNFIENLKIFLSKKLNIFSFSLVMFLIFIAIFSPILSPHQFDQVNPSNALAPPSLEHFMGTDTTGRDIFSRVLHGTTTSLSLALTTIIFGLITGVSLGAIAGYFVGIVDEIIMRIVDVFMSIPGVILALAMVAILGPDPIYLVLALSIRRIIQFARVTRGIVLSIKELDYISACHAIGMGHVRIIFIHVLPNCIGPIIVLSTVLIGNVILMESTLSFLGMGIQEPTPSWGTMIAKGNEFLTFAPWVSVAPGIFLFITMIAFNLLGDGVRDHLDPKDKVAT